MEQLSVIQTLVSYNEEFILKGPYYAHFQDHTFNWELYKNKITNFNVQ